MVGLLENTIVGGCGTGGEPDTERIPPMSARTLRKAPMNKDTWGLPSIYEVT
jgi:hypothetical protein